MSMIANDPQIASIVAMVRDADQRYGPADTEARRLHEASAKASQNAAAINAERSSGLRFLEALCSARVRRLATEEEVAAFARANPLPFRERDLPASGSSDPCPTLRQLLRLQERQARAGQATA